MLVALMFTIPNLQWTYLDHCEIFSGKMVVSLGELEVGCFKTLTPQNKYQDLILPLWGAQKAAKKYEYETPSSRLDIDVQRLTASMVVLK